MKKIRALRDRLLRMAVMGGGGHEITPQIVKARIPHAWFTKKGPGVESDTRRAFHSLMTAGQRQLAVSAGWIPEHWLSRKELKKWTQLQG